MIQVWRKGVNTNDTSPIGKGNGSKSDDTITVTSWTNRPPLTVGETYQVKERALYQTTCATSTPDGNPVATFTVTE
jgi:hypothetical protein